MLMKGWMRWAPCLMLALVLAAGCEKAPRIAPLGPDAVILAFGDSLTAGTGASAEESYPAVLEKRLGRTVINAGVPGEVSAKGLARLPDALERYRPALVILIHGGNDLLRRKDPSEVAENLRGMVSLVRDWGADAILVGVPRPGLFLSPPSFYGDVAREFRLPFDEEVLGDILAERRLKSDAVHPNAAGYSILAERIAGLIKESSGI